MRFSFKRTQTTVVNGVHFSFVEIISGVPQESVLRPMQLLLYINDLNKENTSQIILFADDSVLCIIIIIIIMVIFKCYFTGELIALT